MLVAGVGVFELFQVGDFGVDFRLLQDFGVVGG